MKEGKNRIEQHSVNCFRESFASNKQIERESNLLSQRLKEDLTKAKPRLLTGKLPEAFKVKNQFNDRKATHKQPLYNFRQAKEKYPAIANIEDNNKNSYQTQKQKTSDPFSSDNCDSDKESSPKRKDKEGTFSTRTRTESDETDKDRKAFKRPIVMRETPFHSLKAQTITNKIQSSSEYFNEDNALIRQQSNNTINNAKKFSLFPMELNSSRNCSGKSLSSNMSNRKFALEDGFSYFAHTSQYKHYFYVPTADIYFLKKLEYNSLVIENIKAWKQQNNSNASFLKVHQYFINNPEGCISVLMEHPCGFNLFDIINATGVADNYLLNKIAKDCLLFLCKHNQVNNSKDYGLFCLCDLFYDVNGNMKVIPNLFQNQEHNNTLCECKSFIRQIAKRLSIPITQYLSLGVVLIQCAIGNIPLKCFEVLLSNIEPTQTKCCLLHTLLLIEKSIPSPKDTLLLTNFFRFLPEKFTQFLCALLSINPSMQMSSLRNPWLSQIAIRPNVSLHMKELLRIVIECSSTTASPEQELNKFLRNFDIVFSHLKEAKDSKLFLSNLMNKVNVINSICQSLDVEPSNLTSKLHGNIKEV